MTRPVSIDTPENMNKTRYRRIMPAVVKKRIDEAERGQFFIVSTSGPLAFLLKAGNTSTTDKPESVDTLTEENHVNSLKKKTGKYWIVTPSFQSMSG